MRQHIARLTDFGTPGKLPVPAKGNRVLLRRRGRGSRLRRPRHRQGAPLLHPHLLDQGGRERRITIGTFPTGRLAAARERPASFKRADR